MKTRGEYKDSRDYFLGRTVPWWVLLVALSRVFFRVFLDSGLMFVVAILLTILTILTIVFACQAMYNWAQMKSRSKWYTALGLCFPLGCLPMALLKER